MSERDDKPPVAAVFQVVFDQKVGYTIAWKRSLDNVDLDGVEFKSLPSGLHAVKEDLVYFLHGANVGISVFVQEEADARQRNANFVAVGALVPLKHGQLGQSWAHADQLRRLAKETVGRTAESQALQRFWEQHRADNNASPLAASTSSAAAKRKRAATEATLAGFDAESSWPLDHPALHVPAMLETFGPLLFPLHRAALARQRVLLLGSPSVQKNSHTVYLTSILSTISKSFAESLPSETEPLLRSSPLFSVGVHDIPELSSRASNIGGWIATSTDEILSDKKDLYDLLVRLPSHTGHSRVWPELKTSSGRIVKASQRDLHRWTLLRRELRRLRRRTVSKFADEAPSLVTDNDQRPLLERQDTSSSSAIDLHDPILSTRDSSAAVEPPTWSAMAYRGFMWWASAGDVSAWENEESAADEELLFDMPDLGGGSLPHASDGDDQEQQQQQTQEDIVSEYARSAATLLVAYFRRVTEGILRPMMSLVEAADDDRGDDDDDDDGADEGTEEDEIEISGEDLRAMGLDTWSESDKTFVRDMMKTWFGRTAVVAESGVRVCGVRMY